MPERKKLLFRHNIYAGTGAIDHFCGATLLDAKKRPLMRTHIRLSFNAGTHVLPTQTHLTTHRSVRPRKSIHILQGIPAHTDRRFSVIPEQELLTLRPRFMSKDYHKKWILSSAFFMFLYYAQKIYTFFVEYYSISAMIPVLTFNYNML